MAFGDLFLEDVRAYREERMRATGMKTLFPLWGEPTGRLAAEMVDAGTRFSLHTSAPGKALLAFLPERVTHTSS